MQHIGALSYNGEQSFMVGHNYMVGQSYIGGQSYMNGQSHTAGQSQMVGKSYIMRSPMLPNMMCNPYYGQPNMVQGGGIPFQPSMLGEINGTNQIMINVPSGPNNLPSLQNTQSWNE